MIRAFVALPLPDDLVHQLARVQALLPLPRRAETESFHLTLAFLGETPEPVLEACHEAFERIVAPRFFLRFTRLGLFGGARPHLAYAAPDPEPALDRLQRKVATAAERAGARIERRRFFPHVTLGRFPVPPPDAVMRLERAIAAGSGLGAEAWPIDAFALFRSHLGRRGAVHDELVRYDLAG